MTMDTVIRLGEIELPKGVTAVADPDLAVVTVLVTKAETAAAAAATAEGATPAEGAAPAEGGDENKSAS
jgi:hypothetical protein